LPAISSSSFALAEGSSGPRTSSGQVDAVDLDLDLPQIVGEILAA
jgi:hypothetical protein